MYQPWVGYHYKLGPRDMIELRWSTYLAMWDSVKD